MAKREFDESTVLQQLDKKADIQINRHNKQIVELTRKKSKGDIGIKSKGKIDFLTRYRGWNHFYVDSFN